MCLTVISLGRELNENNTFMNQNAILERPVSMCYIPWRPWWWRHRVQHMSWCVLVVVDVAYPKSNSVWFFYNACCHFRILNDNSCNYNTWETWAYQLSILCLWALSERSLKLLEQSVLTASGNVLCLTVDSDSSLKTIESCILFVSTRTGDSAAACCRTRDSSLPTHTIVCLF